MKLKYFTLCSFTAIGLALSACEVEKTQEGKLPDVDVEVSGGQLPKYDVDAPDVDINSKEVEVSVPDVDVHMEEKTLTVPDVDVDMPDEDDPEEDDEAER